MNAQTKAASPGRGEAAQHNTINAQFSPVGSLLSRLDRVKRTGPNTWLASCPTRDDKHPSMTIREMDDGRVLLHDFGGDSVEEILGALGLTFSDLYPERITSHHVKQERRVFPAADILRAIGFEALVVGCAASSMLAGEPFTQTDRDRLLVAVGRIQAALDAGGLNHG